MLEYISSLWYWLQGRPNTSTKNGFGRKLGTSEVLMRDINRQNILIISSVIFISSIRKLREDNITWVLERLMKIHPLLRSRIITYKNQAFWKEMDNLEVDFRVVISGDWHSVFSENTLEVFNDSTGPLWRVTFMPNVSHEYKDEHFEHHSAFIFAFSHSIIDGQARMLLMNDFQDLLSASLHHDYSTIEQVKLHLGEAKSLPICPPFEEFVWKSLDLPHRILYCILRIPFIQRFLYRILKRANSKLHPYEQCVVAASSVLESDLVNTENPKTCIYPMVLNETQTALMRKACKLQDITIQSLIQAATTISVCELILDLAKQNGVAKEDLAKSTNGCSAALRMNLPESAFKDYSYVASLVYGISQSVDINHNAEEDQFWPLAQDIMKSIHADKNKCMRQAMLCQQIMKDIGKEPAKPCRRNLLSYTNLGNCNYLNRGTEHEKEGVKITGHFSAAGEHITGPVFANCITTIDDKMYWGAVYYPNVTSRELAARYLHRAIDLIMQNCTQVVHVVDS